MPLAPALPLTLPTSTATAFPSPPSSPPFFSSSASTTAAAAAASPSSFSSPSPCRLPHPKTWRCSQTSSSRPIVSPRR
jgi:hypothetical protein